MDQQIHTSLTNCIKELQALDKLVTNDHLSYSEVSEFLKEVVWQLENMFNGISYTSDELQYILSKYEE